MTRARPDLDVSSNWLDYPSAPLDWRAVFDRVAPVELEIGPGKGLFLARSGALYPDRDFIGVEVSPKYARLAAERVTKQGLKNVRVAAGDARRFLAEFVPVASLSVVHVYFPDPWWKQRHRKRRVVCAEFIEDAARALASGGALSLATDVDEYFQVMIRLVSGHPDFAAVPPPEPSDPAHELDYLTNFERKYRKEGRRIHRACFRRRDRAGEARP